MDPRFQTSFIPKKPIATESQSRVKTVNLFVLTATIIFLVAMSATGATFFYERLVRSQIEQDKESLNKAREAFDPELINKIVRLDNRINTSKKLLEDHIAASYFFDLLEKTTLKTVRFKDFSIEYLSKDKITVSMKGQAQGFVAVALQSDKFSSDSLFKNTIIGDIALEPAGTVSFSVISSVDPSVLSYVSNMNPVVIPTPVPTSSTAPASTAPAPTPTPTPTPAGSGATTNTSGSDDFMDSGFSF